MLKNTGKKKKPPTTTQSVSNPIPFLTFPPLHFPCIGFYYKTKH